MRQRWRRGHEYDDHGPPHAYPRCSHQIHHFFSPLGLLRYAEERHDRRSLFSSQINMSDSCLLRLTEPRVLNRHVHLNVAPLRCIAAIEPRERQLEWELDAVHLAVIGVIE